MAVSPSFPRLLSVPLEEALQLITSFSPYYFVAYFRRPRIAERLPRNGGTKRDLIPPLCKFAQVFTPLSQFSAAHPYTVLRCISVPSGRASVPSPRGPLLRRIVVPFLRLPPGGGRRDLP